MKYLKFIAISLSLILAGCVEHLITVSVYPDGKYQIIFESKGDSLDVFDSDFPHPPNRLPWVSETAFELNEDDQKIWNITTAGIFKDSIQFPLLTDQTGALQHGVTVKKNEGFISTQYSIKYQFKGRSVFAKFPKLGHMLQSDESADSIQWQSETLTYIFSSALSDLKSDSIMPIDDQLFGRLENHLNTYIARLRDFRQTEEIFSDLDSILTTALHPFQSRLPDTFLENLLDRIRPYEHEVSTTIKLKDDQFLFRCTLPGKLLYANADSLAGDTLIWKFDLDNFIQDDYQIFAGSVVYEPHQFQRIILFATLLFLFLVWLAWKIIFKIKPAAV